MCRAAPRRRPARRRPRSARRGRRPSRWSRYRRRGTRSQRPAGLANPRTTDASAPAGRIARERAPGRARGPVRTTGAKASALALSLDDVPRSATIHTCSACGHQSPKWHGRCPGCGEWDAMVEEAAAPTAARGANGGRRAGGTGRGRAPKPVALADVEAPRVQRLGTGIGEFDRVLGGGLVPGSLVLIGGSPGIGKSTLTSGALGNLQAAGHKTLYVSGEESAAQVKLRAERLGPSALTVPIVAETDLDSVLATLEAERPDVCVIDSVQVLYDAALTGAPGSVGQGREVAGRLMRIAKERGIATLLVGHVTKEGSLAGPRVLEHLVDCVLSFEGERERTYRTLRALKNRFGSTNEVGVFEM